ncbi:MAG: AAA family ATPase, partial [Clostridia bacterium]|nr:AAA family ATPase [Clostridia bacterium]
VEKAHPDVFNVLLQILDDGRVTDSQGRTVDFKNTVIILTSNLGSSVILEGIDYAGDLKDEAKAEVESLLKRSFRPEFLNRLDETVFFKPLDKKQIGEIVRLLAKDLTKRLAEKQIKLTISDKAVAYIVASGYDANFGARPLKRYLQRKLETVIAKKLLEGAFTTGDEILVDADENGLTLQKA